MVKRCRQTENSNGTESFYCFQWLILHSKHFVVVFGHLLTTFATSDTNHPKIIHINLPVTNLEVMTQSQNNIAFGLKLISGPITSEKLNWDTALCKRGPISRRETCLLSAVNQSIKTYTHNMLHPQRLNQMHKNRPQSRVRNRER